MIYIVIRSLTVSWTQGVLHKTSDIARAAGIIVFEERQIMGFAIAAAMRDLSQQAESEIVGEWEEVLMFVADFVVFEIAARYCYQA